MSRRVVVTGVGLVSASGHRHRGDLAGGSCRAATGLARSRNSMRRNSPADRRGSEELRPGQLHREKRNQEDGALHSVRHRGVGIRPARQRPESRRRRTPSASAFTSAAASVDSKSSSASTRTCCNTGRAASRHFSFRRPSSIWPPVTFRSAPEPRVPTPRPLPPAPPARIPSAIRSRSSSAMTPT